MKQSKIDRIRQLHKKVVHAQNHLREIAEYTDEEMMEEDKAIGGISSLYLLNQICTTCFHLEQTPFDPKYSSRTSAQYAITYPKINRAVDAAERNMGLAEN